MPGRMEFEFSNRGNAPGAKREHQPFNLLILGSFSGDAQVLSGNAPESIANRRIIEVDLDNKEQLWPTFAPQLSLQMKTASIDFSPRDIDDFHPDQLVRNLPVFGNLRDLRKRLQNPDSAQSALDEILASGAVIESEVADEPQAAEQNEVTEDSGEMFERLLGGASSSHAAPGAVPSELRKLDSFIQDLVAPHIVHEADPRVDTAIDSVDLASSELMRSILHHPSFQALEGSWRSLFDLVSELELDENLHLYVCDARQEELLAGLPDPGSSLQDSPLFQLLVERRRQAGDDTPFTVMVGDYYFGPEPGDVALLTALGAAAAMNGGAFLGAARPSMLGCNTVAEMADAKYWSSAEGDSSLWQSLRTSAVADRLGLALPRVLARLPYGEATEEIDSFAFEEMPQRSHEDYLWANPAYYCGRMLAESFTNRGWDMDSDDTLNLGYLPAHNYTEDGESRLQPCAELLLSESTMVAILDQGLMPLISYRSQNTAVLGRFQSIASPAAALEGPWGR
jgi:type VI secretion system protein ImpC